MSLVLGAPTRDVRASDRLLQLAVAAAAIMAVALVAILAARAFLPAAGQTVGRNPFGIGLREAPPSFGALGSLIVAYQAQFNRAIEGALVGFRGDGTAAWLLVALGFGYGVFHAAGPGHGKGVIAAYLVANERMLARGLAISFAAALLQGLVAILVVAVAAIGFRATAPTLTRTAEAVEMASFAAVLLFGLVLAWRKAGTALALTTGRGAGAACAPGACSHGEVPGPEILARASLSELAAIVVAAGLRPCSGAILVLVFALSEKLFWAGILSVAAMSLGTALTTGSVAALAVYAKRAALGLASRRTGGLEAAVAWFELATAAAVVVLGSALLFGLSAGFLAG